MHIFLRKIAFSLIVLTLGLEGCTTLKDKSHSSISPEDEVLESINSNQDSDRTVLALSPIAQVKMKDEASPSQSGTLDAIHHDKKQLSITRNNNTSFIPLNTIKEIIFSLDPIVEESENLVMRGEETWTVPLREFQIDPSKKSFAEVKTSSINKEKEKISEEGFLTGISLYFVKKMEFKNSQEIVIDVSPANP